MRITGNTVLITGGATGIGLALAQALVARDNTVIICGRRRDRLEAAQRAQPALQTLVADVSSPPSRADLVAAIGQRFPRTNILVNNAGVQHKIDLREPGDLAKAEEELATNVVAPLYLTAMLLPQLVRNLPAAVVNVTSGLAFAPLAHVPVYCGTKAAMHSITLSLRHQLRETGVRVFEMAPPLVRSELGARHRPPKVNTMAMPAEQCAAEMVAALERDEFDVAIGDAANSRAGREALFAVMNQR